MHNRVALQTQARNEGHDLAREGNETIQQASKWNPQLATACEVWRAISRNWKAPVFRYIRKKKEMSQMC